MSGVLISEWVKTRSVGATLLIIAVAVFGVLAAALLAWRGVSMWDALTPDRQAVFRQATMAQVVTPVLQLCAAAFGVLTITSEYATGAIRPSLVAVPARMKLLFSKAIVVAALAWPFAFLTLSMTDLLQTAIIGHRRLFPGHGAGLPADLIFLIAQATVMTVISLVGLGLGTAFRSSVGALIAVAALLFMLPMLANYLPGSLGDGVRSLSLANLAEQIARTPSRQGALSMLAASTAAVAYAATTLCAGAVRISQSDA